LRAGGTEQQAGLIRNWNRFVQFRPSRLKLLGRTRMIKAVESRVFEQDVEAANKRARRHQLGVARIHNVRSQNETSST
jgi:hypothetical protein